MSQSPLENGAAGGEAEAYAASWSALNRLLRRGYSWSGRERNCAFLNLGGKGYANVSAASGFDFPDDARATALCDWDGDGDQDVFVTNRTAPRVRFLRNDQATRNASVTLELRGTRANRDAIGARVELSVEENGVVRRIVRAVRAGEGYLAQSSGRLTIGLGAPSSKLSAVRVVWPGGEAEGFRGIEAGRAWLLVQGSGRAEPLTNAGGTRARAKPLSPSTPTVPAMGLAARIPLVRPVPLPRLEFILEDGAILPLFGIQAGGQGTGTGKPILLELFSTTCAPCARELGQLAERAEDLTTAGLAPFAVSVEPVAEAARAAAFLHERAWPFPWATASPLALELLDGLQARLLDRERRLQLPASFLVDAAGALRVIYLGPVSPEQLLADRALCELGEGALFDTVAPFPGRWMFPGLPDDADFLAGALEARGLVGAAQELARGRFSVVRTAPADLLQEFGRRSAIEGRLEEAGTFFQRALAADPRHFGALFDWAIVLHRQGSLAEAAELYGKALVLRPDHADAHFNLGLARFGLGDRSGAEREQRWLETHRAEGAEDLRRILAEPARGE